jgi:hypothetical protein
VISNEARVALDRFLTTDPADAGCEQTLALLDAYVEVAAVGEDPERTYPGIAAHLRACGPCGDDYEGLLLAVLGPESTADRSE